MKRSGGSRGFSAEAFTIDFGNFQSQAELTYPEQEGGPFPTVILIHGSGPGDMNAAIPTFGLDVKPILPFPIFKDVSSYLSKNGFAVLRYHKHYVTGPGQVNFQKFYTKLDLPQMLSDAEKVLETVVTNPKIDETQVFLYGWSEGSTVAAALAVKRPELRGLILQGPVTVPWRDLFLYQILEVGLPYLRQSTDERVTVETLKQLQTGGGGLVAKGILNYLGDPVKFQRGTLAVNPALDTNRDGMLEPNELTLQAFSKVLDDLLSPRGYLNIYSSESALPSVTQQAASLKLPLLILQGAHDASVPVRGVKVLEAELDKTGNPDYTLEVYPNLGHSLGRTGSVIADNFQPIARQPLEDLVGWLRAHATL